MTSRYREIDIRVQESLQLRDTHSSELIASHATSEIPFRDQDSPDALPSGH